MAIVVHVRTSIDSGRRYGADQARVLLNELLPVAPDVPVQIAHLAGAGGYEASAESALSVLVEAIGNRDRRTVNVWFDATTVVQYDTGPADLQQIAARIRQIGVERELYGSDAAASPATHPKAGWAAFRQHPLTQDAFGVIAGNISPAMRD